MRDMTKKELDNARFVYDTIIAYTKRPTDALNILIYCHARLWINCRVEGGDTEAMLEDYISNLRHNITLNEPTKGTA